MSAPWRQRNVSLAAVLAASLLVVFDGHRCLAQDSPGTAAPGDALAKDIATSVLALGYPKSTADDLAFLVRGWKCEPWKEKLSQATQAYQQKRTPLADVAQTEVGVTKELYETIGKEIASDKASPFFYLPKVVKDKRANSLGYSQLFYVVGSSLGLKVAVVNVLELAAGPPPAGDAHVACSVSLADGTLDDRGRSTKGHGQALCIQGPVCRRGQLLGA